MGQGTGTLKPETPDGRLEAYVAPPANNANANHPAASLAKDNDWRKNMDPGRSERLLNEWDEKHIQTTIQGIFKQVDKGGSGYLEWNNSQIKNFVNEVFKAKGLPIPNVPESVWYQMYREVDHNGDYKLEQNEAVEFALHCFQRILQMHDQPVKMPVTVIRAAPMYTTTTVRRIAW